MNVTEFRSDLLNAVLDCLIPPDDFPGAVAAGVPEYVNRQLNGDLRHLASKITDGLAALDSEARDSAGGDFWQLTAQAQTDLLRRVEAGEVQSVWTVPPGEFLALMVNLAAEGYYADPGNGGNLEEISWKMMGYSPRRPVPEPELPTIPVLPNTPPMPAVTDEYDVVVVGAGVAGGIVAAKLAEAGRRVLLLERGRHFEHLSDVPRDHLRNHRLALYGVNTDSNMEDKPRVHVDQRGRVQVVKPFEPNYHLNAMTLGGGALVYGMQAWRFLPDDFRMATKYGVPEGSSLADWPISYDDLAPYYDQAEWEIGVAGDATGHLNKGARARPYPMPPVRDNAMRVVLNKGAAKLGWQTAPVPLAMNTVARDGRDACIECAQCIGFACPVNAKAGSFNTMLPRAFATGHCTLVCEAQAERIQTDANGKVTGLSYFTIKEGQPVRHVVRAAQVVVSAGAIESARLLLLSANSREPNGLGNNSDQVGRHLQGHYYPGALGLFEESVYDGIGPGVAISTCDFNHDNEGVIGGAMLANEFVKIPIIYWRGDLPPELPKWGLQSKRWVRENYRRTHTVQGPVQEIPSPEGRVTLDPEVRDRFGLPVIRSSGTQHPETVRTSEFMRQKAIAWLKASGAKKVWSYPVTLGLSGGQHQAGTCRMGKDPKTSVTDSYGRVHGHENLFVVDGAIHVTNGGFNPVLTIMALAFRSAEEIARST
ncbi:GMC family oxidoreductase [soil metagenome]